MPYCVNIQDRDENMMLSCQLGLNHDNAYPDTFSFQPLNGTRSKNKAQTSDKERN